MVFFFGWFQGFWSILQWRRALEQTKDGYFTLGK